VDEVQEKLDVVNSENGKIKDALEKEQQAAIEAEEQCTKLESMKGKLEDEVSVSWAGGLLAVSGRGLDGGSGTGSYSKA